MAASTCFRAAALLLVLAAGARRAEAQVEVEAYAGEPFGVGRITVTVTGAEDRTLDDAHLLIGRRGRVLYATLAHKPIVGLLRDLFNGGRPILRRPERITAYFLFVGDGPLDLTFYTPNIHRATVAPVRDPRRYGPLLQAWWGQYVEHAKDLADSGEYPMVIESYLMPTLAKRLNLPLPDSLFALRPDEPEKSLRLLAGTESLERAMRRRIMLDAGEPQPATLPLPPPVPGQPETLPAPGEKPEIEPIALHVPVESLYVRFGNFSNYLWLREFMQAWGGNLQNMIQVRSLDYRISERQQEQIALHETALAELLGPTIIADVAFVGFDTFMREGAAFGILFQARNNLALRADFTNQRNESLKKHPDAKEETVQIAGRDVSFLHTPDNRVRSFYAVDGDYHLVTTSRELVRRFYEAGEGKGALGAAPEFLEARGRMPFEGDQTIFAYFSEPFFRQLVSPKYRVEMKRRMTAAIDIQLLMLARLTAKNEGKTAHSIEELIAAGLLPRGFAPRPDGSRPVERDGELIDSLRGARRTFLPISDVEIEAITPGELAAYERFREFYVNEWRQMDPMMAVVRREELNDQGLQRLRIEAHVTPYLRSHYGELGAWLGRPTTQTVKRVPGDLVFFNAVLGRDLAAGPPPQSPDYLLFGGLRGLHLPTRGPTGNILLALGPRPLEFVEGYLGAWPRSGILSLLTGDPNQTVFDPAGYAPVLRGLAWQRRFGNFTVLSLSQQVLAQVTPQLRVVEAAAPAQLRIQAVDPTKTNAMEQLNALAYTRAREATRSNSRFMNRLSDQLHVPRPKSKDLAEDLLQARLAPALGGKYEMVQFRGGLRIWKSTALADPTRFAVSEKPAPYEFPLLQWFRGLNARLLMTDNTMSAFATLDVQGEKTEQGFQLPSLPGF